MKQTLLIERSRGLLRVTGRDPIKMIDGLATADITAVEPGRGVYTAFLTPKGRMVADARVFRDPTPDAADGDLLLDTAPDALDALVQHIRKFVPPLFAKAADVSAEWAVLGVYGPGSDEVVAAVGEGENAPGADAPVDGGADAASAGADEERVVAIESGIRVRTYLTGDPGWDIFVPAARRDDTIETLREAGARPGDPESVDALRVEAGRPRWGRELGPDVIPLEAGLLERAISQDKGCYTGQEVIVRILHRGHVNRHLRRLEFAGAVPEPGTDLFEPDLDKPRGTVTSAVENDTGALGLGYVRREVEPPAELRVGSPDGDPVRVTALD